MAISEDPEEAISRARTAASEYDQAKDEFARSSDARIASINELRDYGVSWAKIGRIFGTSPQAAMYVSGHAKRTTAKPKAKSRTKK